MKKINYLILVMIFLFAILPIVSAVKPITNIQTTEGYSIEPTEKSAILLNTNHSFELHVFNISSGMPITSGITCYLHLYHESGEHIYTGETSTVSHIFDYSFDLDANNFSKRGEYEAKFQCNSSTLGGSTQLFFIVNGFGEELTTAHSFKFNSAMLFFMILFLLALGGVIGFETPVGKFACYWVAHTLFIIGTFCMWQFNQGYTTSFLGMVGVWKVMFYVSIFAMLPMIILSIAMMIVYFSTGKEITRLMDHGMSEDEAYRRQGKKYK